MSWVLTVAGVAVLTVLCDIIIPDGKNRKYIKTVLGVVVTLVIVQPLIGLFNGEIELGASSGYTVEPQTKYLETFNSKKNEQLLSRLKLTLLNSDIDVEEIKLNSSDKSLRITVNGKRTSKKEKSLNDSVKMFFPDYKIKAVWVDNEQIT